MRTFQKTGSFSKINYFFLSLISGYAFFLPNNHIVSLSYLQRTPVSIFGVLILFFVLFFRQIKIEKLGVFIVASFLFILSFDFFRVRVWDEYLVVFIFNILTFYCISIVLSRIGNRSILFVMFSFILGFLFFSFLFLNENSTLNERPFISGFNPNDFAALGLFAISFLYYIVANLDLLFSVGRVKKFFKVLALLVSFSLVLITSYTATRFAIIGVFIISSAALIHLYFLKKIKMDYLFECSVFLVGLVLSAAMIFGLSSFFSASDRFSLEYSKCEVNGLRYNIIVDGKLQNYDLGVVDSSVSSLGGRLPAWKLAYFSSMNNPFMGIGRYEFDKQRNKLNVPSAHNLIVESYILAGFPGGALSLMAIIFVIIFFKKKYFSFENSFHYLLAIPLVITCLMLNVWYLKVFWFGMSILVGLLVLEGTYRENSIGN